MIQRREIYVIYQQQGSNGDVLDVEKWEILKRQEFSFPSAGLPGCTRAYVCSTWFNTGKDRRRWRSTPHLNPQTQAVGSATAEEAETKAHNSLHQDACYTDQEQEQNKQTAHRHNQSQHDTVYSWLRLFTQSYLKLTRALESNQHNGQRKTIRQNRVGKEGTAVVSILNYRQFKHWRYPVTEANIGEFFA